MTAPEPSAPLALTLFGAFQARLGVVPLRLPIKKARAMLTYLAVTREARPRDTLAKLLWSDAGARAARNSLRQTLFAIRKALPPAAATALVIDTDTIALDAGAVDVDVSDFERALAGGRPQALERAVRLYRGDLVADLRLNERGFDEWLDRERARLRGLVRGALVRLITHYSAEGARGLAIESAERCLTFDPLDEAMHRTLMRLYAEEGRYASALRQYQLCLGMLERQLGVEPEPETRRLYQHVLQQRGFEADAAPAPAAPGAEPPLVGRVAELARLGELIRRAAGSESGLVAVLGEAGIGKTRLVREVMGEARRCGARVLMAVSHEAERILALRPWADALRAGGVIAADATDLPPVWRIELGRLFPELGAGGPEPGAPVADHAHRLFEALARLLSTVAARQTLVLVVEDLHWADELSVRFLSFLAHRLPAGMLVLITAREEEVLDSPLLHQLLQQLEREQHLTRIVLAPLARVETQSLVQSLARAGMPPPLLGRLTRQIWTASEGNPFVIVEMMRAVEQGAAAPTGEVPLPEKVHELIAGRLERLSEAAQQLAAVAAVIGGAFEFPLLQRAVGLGERAAAEAVEELVRRRVLQPAGERFDFAHHRIREVAYERLLPVRRKLLHRQVAEALEALAAEDHGTIGLHYRRAEEWARALPHLRAAGTAAFWRGGHREAAASFEQALDCLRHLPQLKENFEQAIDVRFDLRHALVPLADFVRIARHLREAERLAERLGDRARLGQLAVYLANSHWWFGEHQRALERCESAVAAARQLADPQLELSAALHMGLARQALGDHRGAVKLFRGVVAAGERARTPERSLGGSLTGAYARAYLVMSLAELGEFAEAAPRAQEALRLAETLRHPFALAHAFIAAASVAIRKGDFKDALPFERYRAFRRDVEIGDVWPLADWYLGYGYALSGRVADALPLLEEIVQPTSSAAGVVGRSLLSAWLAETYALTGRRDDAVFLAAQSVDLAREHGERGHEGWVVRLRGDLAATAEPLDAAAAERHYHHALGIAGELGMRPLAAQCRLGLGLLYGRAHRQHEAREELEAARALMSALGMTHWLAGAEAALAIL